MLCLARDRYGNPSVFMSARGGSALGGSALGENSAVGGSPSFGLGLLALDDVFAVHAQAVNRAVRDGITHCPDLNVTSPPSVP